MAKAVLLISLPILLLARPAVAQFHDPVYLMGGIGGASTQDLAGIWLGDYNNRSSTKLSKNVTFYYSWSIQMDADNRSIVLGVEGDYWTPSTTLQSGIFRYDPATHQTTTLRVGSIDMYSVKHMLINQDGDYVYTADYIVQPGPVPTTEQALFKLGPGGRISTLLSSLRLGAGAKFFDVGIDMDTGRYLVNVDVPSVMDHAVLEVALDGSTFTTFGGVNFGWSDEFDSLYQDFDTGNIVGQSYGRLYSLKRGAASRTTLWRLAHPGSFILFGTSRFDLQSAPAKRIVSIGREFLSALSQPAAVFYIDVRPPYAVTATNLDKNLTGPMNTSTRSLDFYRGRHLQTVRTGKGKWDIRMSCPKFPNRAYVLLVSQQGYRPGIQLPDGRKLHLNFDRFFELSMKNLLRPYVDPGPLRLDAQGEALGKINVSGLPSLNVPIWLAMVVLDSASPSGVAYLPDTYVMRL